MEPSDDQPERANCYEASPGCKCARDECGGVKDMLMDCPIHGVDGPVQLRLHGCQRAQSMQRARMMASRRTSGS